MITQENPSSKDDQDNVYDGCEFLKALKNSASYIKTQFINSTTQINTSILTAKVFKLSWFVYVLLLFVPFILFRYCFRKTKSYPEKIIEYADQYSNEFISVKQLVLIILALCLVVLLISYYSRRFNVKVAQNQRMQRSKTKSKNTELSGPKNNGAMIASYSISKSHILAECILFNMWWKGKCRFSIDKKLKELLKTESDIIVEIKSFARQLECLIIKSLATSKNLDVSKAQRKQIMRSWFQNLSPHLQKKLEKNIGLTKEIGKLTSILKKESRGILKDSFQNSAVVENLYKQACVTKEIEENFRRFEQLQNEGRNNLNEPSNQILSANMLPLHSSTLKPTPECKIEYHENTKLEKHGPDPVTNIADIHGLHRYDDKTDNKLQPTECAKQTETVTREKQDTLANNRTMFPAQSPNELNKMSKQNELINTETTQDIVTGIRKSIAHLINT